MTLSTLVDVGLFGLVWGGLYALVAYGLNLIYGVMKILNIAHGEMLMLGAYGAFWLYTSYGLSPLLAILIIGPAITLLGMVMQRFVVDPILRRTGSLEATEKATLIAFFGILLVLQNGALVLWSSNYRVLDVWEDPVGFAGVSVAENRLVALAAALAISLGMYYLMRHTDLGKALRAVSEDRRTAQLMGLDSRRIALIGFAIGSALAAVAGILVSMIYVITPTMGLLFTVKAFAVMVIAGLGSQAGTLAAGLVLGVTESLGGFVVGSGYRDLIGYLLLIVAILLRARFLAGARDRG